MLMDPPGAEEHDTLGEADLTNPPGDLSSSLANFSESKMNLSSSLLPPVRSTEDLVSNMSPPKEPLLEKSVSRPLLDPRVLCAELWSICSLMHIVS